VEEMETPWWRQASADDFAKIVSSVKTIWSTGGNPFLTVLSLSPFYNTADGRPTKFPNFYGLAILDAVRRGDAIYMGQSAGSVAMSFALGPLTGDAAVFEIEEADNVHRKLDLSENGILGRSWMFPPAQEYLGIPYRLIFRPHLRVNANTLSFGGSSMGAHRIDEALDHSEHGCEHDSFVVLMQDYEYDNGRGDSVWIHNGKVYYLVSKSDDEIEIPTDATPNLPKLHSKWVDEHRKVRVQPPCVPAGGMTLEWDPKRGELKASGPGCQIPFHLYITEQSMMPDAPPY